MKDINLVIICGNIASQIWDNESNVRFTVATNVWDYTQKKDIAKFINVVAFGRSAKYIRDYAQKGTRIEMIGSLENYEQTKDGKKTYTLSCIVKEAQLISKDYNRTSKPKETVDDYDTEDVGMEEV